MFRTLYRLMGRSDFFGWNQCRLTATLPPMISVSPSVTLVGGPGRFGSER